MNQKDYVSIFTKYIPIFSIVSLLFGVTNLTAYYNYYNINILPYLEINEVIFLTLKDFIIITLIISFSFLASYKKETNNPPPESFKDIYIQSSFLDVLKRNKKERTLFLILLIIILSFSILKLVLSIPTSTWLLAITGFITLIILLFFDIVINRTYYKFFRRLPNKHIVIVSLLCLTLFSAAMILGYYKSNCLKENGDYLKNSITIEGKEQKSNHGYYYIGKTSKYVFFYNDTTGLCDRIPISRITMMSLKE